MAEKLIVLTSTMALKGGTNRVIADLVRGLSRRVDVAILSFEAPGSVYELPDSVRMISVANGFSYTSSRALRTLNTLWLTRRLARVIADERPRVVMSFTTRPNVANAIIKALYKKKYRCILCERNFNSISYQNSLLGRVFFHLMRATYPLADVVIANASDLADDLNRSYGVPANKLSVVYNPFDLKRIEALSQGPVDERWFNEDTPVLLNVARLIEQKNHELLLRAFARVRRNIPCRLAILGEGPLRNRLQHTAEDLGVENDVAFLGWRDNPFKYMRRAHAFVLSSDFEGYPSVLTEAMASGCPVISTDCPSGPREILEAGKCGLLVPMKDEGALTEGIQTILTNEILRRDLVARGKARAEAFDPETIVDQYERIILNGA
jgi:glycosyltransferase involved in cell wall biosynthesis